MAIGAVGYPGGIMPMAAHVPAVATPLRPAAAAGVPADAANATGQGAFGAEPGAPAGTQADPAALAWQRAQANVMNDKFNQECQTCKHRTYQDGSNDAGVSFKTPTHIAPGASAAMVSSHEQEHVMRERANAKASGGEVLMQTVILHGAVCPECGRPYIAGGTTRTVTRIGGQKNPYQAAMAGQNSAPKGAGLNAVA